MSQGKMTYEGLIAEMTGFAGNDGDIIGGYLARPLGAGPFPAVIVIHEVFGLVEHTREIARKFAAHGYLALAPDLYFREGPGDPEKVSAAVRQARRCR
jgi:carboxymethylenebutenolidase